jgi:hypothetical protein
MKTPANDRERLGVSLYFQCSEIDGAKWQVLKNMFLPQFQIETLLAAASANRVGILC